MKNISKEVDKSHWRTQDHVESRVKNVKPEKLKEVIESKEHDRFIKLRNIEPYYVKIFSTVPNCWFHDLMDNGKNQHPRYWHIFLGVNNHFAVALPLENKSARALRGTLSEFVEKYKPVKLTSDEESAVCEKGNIQYLTDNNVSVHLITEKNHSALGTIDRFIRTLRDMHIPNEKTDNQSHEDKYKTFSEKRMAKLIEIYNNSYHTRLGCTPKQMFDDPKKEKDYIFMHLEKREKQEQMKDFKLKVGDFVRYIIPRANGRKKRFQYSWECYKIEVVKGNMYTLIARDGRVMNLPRFKLLPVKNTKVIKWAKTIPGRNNGVIKRVGDYDPVKKKWQVFFVVPDKEDYEDWLPDSYLRENFPQFMRHKPKPT